MINKDKLKSILDGYTAYFPKAWEKGEMEKWQAIKCFQDNWDIDTENFEVMFANATHHAAFLLSAMNFYPRKMILNFAKADAEATRSMFRKLYDESLPLKDRVNAFQTESEALRAKYDDDGTWRNHYQKTNAISTYLWLKYPDKYYILKYFSEYYNSTYRIETTQDAKNDYPEFARKFIINIRKNNEQQGKDGRYFGHGTNEIRAICLMMMTDGVKFDNELINLIITTVTDTIIESKEPLYIKMDAVLLLCLISKHYPSGFNNNSNIINKIYEKRNEINDENIFFLSSNIDEIAVKICLQFLFSLMGHNVHSDLLEMLPYIKNDTATIVFVSNFLLYYITYVGINGIPKTTESVILYNVIEWVDMEHIDIRCNAIRILLMLLGNPEHEDIINRKLKSLAETDSVTVKNLILRNIVDNNAVTNEVKTYFFEVCEKDANYVTRTVCKEMRNKIAY